MVEVKFNPLLFGEIIQFGNDGKEINADVESVSAEGVSSLKTSVKFVEENNDIQQLLKLYQKLILKDVADLNEMMTSAEQLDKVIAKQMK